ncbi:MAG: endonuclease/exonuclease/phosphatase family protein, partial [Bacteroidales bacterium]
DYTDPPARALQLAQEISVAAPDIIGLQEATLWDFTDAKGHRTYDQLALLVDDLAAAGHPYRVVAVQVLTDIPIDIPGLVSARFTDRNAILIRADLPPGQLDVYATGSRLYQASVPFTLPDGTTAPVPQGWMTADVRVRGARFKFVNTHLMSVVPEPPDALAYTTWLQTQQATELLGALQGTSLPIVLVGDFNSGAEFPQQGPDKTPTAAMIAAAGYTDVWAAVKPGVLGYTWGLYREDQPYPNLIVPSSPVERIDLIFSAGVVPTSIAQTGTTIGSLGVFASDHTGVMADFTLDNHRPDVPVKATPRK